MKSKDEKEKSSDNGGMFGEEVKLENIPFHATKKSNESEKKPVNKPKRKEINLSELRRALESSLESKDEEEDEVEENSNTNDGNSIKEIKPGQIIKLDK